MAEMKSNIGGRFPLPSGERSNAQHSGEGGYAPKPARHTKTFARNMPTNPTKAEHRIWFELRNRKLNGYRFSRQVRIGNYIADFICREEKLVIELDGGQHCENTDDAERTVWLNGQGYAVLRFWNDEVYFQRKTVLDTILAVLENQIIAPSPGLRFAPAGLSPKGEEKHR